MVWLEQEPYAPKKVPLVKKTWKALLVKIEEAAAYGIAENKMTDEEIEIAKGLYKADLVLRRLGDVGNAFGFIYYDPSYKDMA